MANERDDWLSYADTNKQVALAEDLRKGPAPPAPKKVPLAALPLEKRRAPDDEERPDSAIREIPAKLSPRDPRADEERAEGDPADEDSVPPLDFDTDLE